MFDVRSSLPTISHTFALSNSRAMQCPAQDPVTGDWYVAQAEGVGTESILITRGTAGPTSRKLSMMRLYKAGHGSTIATLRRGEKLGIVTNAWGRLMWIEYVAGATIKKGDLRAVPIWSGTYAHVDHETSTVSIRSGYTWRLFELDGDKLGARTGKELKDMKGSGPSQGFAHGKVNGEWVLATMWDYGRTTSKPSVVFGSFDSGDRLYTKSARVLSKSYTRQEPESGLFLGGAFYLGMSIKIGGKKKGVAVRFDPAKPEPPKPPPPPPVLVTMHVRPVGDPIWKAPPLEVWNRTASGKFGATRRHPGDTLTGEVVSAWGSKFLKVPTAAKGIFHFYKLAYLTTEVPVPVPVP